MARHRRTVFDHARTHRGLVTIDDLFALGVSSGVRRSMIADGSLTALSRRVFLAGAAPFDEQARALAASLDSRAALSHLASAWLHGIPGFALPSKPDVLRLGRERAHDSQLARIHTTTSLPHDDVTVVDGVEALSVARTLLCLAAMVPALTVERVRGAVDEAVRLGLASDPGCGGASSSCGAVGATAWRCSRRS